MFSLGVGHLGETGTPPPGRTNLKGPPPLERLALPSEGQRYTVGKQVLYILLNVFLLIEIFLSVRL